MEGNTHLVTVITSSGKNELTVRDGENLLMALVNGGFPVEFYCTTGKCTTCRLKITAPDGTITQAGDTERYRLGMEAMIQGFRLTCQVYVHQPLFVYLGS